MFKKTVIKQNVGANQIFREKLFNLYKLERFI